MSAMLSPDEFFRCVFQRYLQAAKTTNEMAIVQVRIGGKVIRFHFASKTLLSVLLPAFQHLITSSHTAVDLDIYLSDSKSTGVSMIQRPWEDNAFLPRGAVQGFSNKTIKTIFQPDRDALSILNVQQNKAVYWVPDAKAVPYFEKGAPLLGILPQWFLANDRIVVHGGAVAGADKGVLITGPGGSGKSTTVLKSLKDPSLQYVSDDYCLLDMNTQIRAHSMYCSAKIDPEQVEMFPSLKAVLYNPDNLQDEKALYFFSPLLAHRLIQDVPVKAILIPRILGKGPTSLCPARAIDGFRALAPSTIFQLADFGHQASRIISKIVQKVPVYYLNLGAESDNIPEVIHDVLIQTI